ncbi:MAG: hypothetical protein EHM47_12875, partial [Ignavibacteriales bacterium]
QLIAEKLLSLHAKEKGYDTMKVFSDIISPLEDMCVRDQLYTNEIKSKVSYSPEDISEGLERIKNILKVKFLYSENKKELEDIYLHLKSGSSFDSILTSRIESSDQEAPREVTFGTMEKEFEDSLYELNPGEFTSVLESEDGYYILYLSDIEGNLDLKDQNMVLEDVKRIIETRLEYEHYLDYYRKFFSKHRVTADKEIFENLVEIFVSTFQKKYSPENDNISSAKAVINEYYLNGIEVTLAYNLLNPEIQSKNFIKLKDRSILPDHFLNKLSHDGFYVRDISEESIRASLSSYIRKFIEDELLTMEGMDKGLDNSPDVKKYIDMWRDSYLSKMLMVSMFDSIKISEEEAYSVYKMNDWQQTVELVNVAEVLTDSLETVEIILNELSKGKDIGLLAKQYTKRDSVRERGGEFGYFPVTENGEIGRAAFNMEVGDVYGPIKLDEGYSVFRLIGKKQDTTVNSKSYDEVKEELISQITLSKFEKYVNGYVAELAQKYGIEIYEDVLEEIDNIYLNLVVVRYMGFGGEIFAVPYTEQFSGWYDIWIDNKEIVQ